MSHQVPQGCVRPALSSHVFSRGRRRGRVNGAGTERTSRTRSPSSARLRLLQLAAACGCDQVVPISAARPAQVPSSTRRLSGASVRCQLIDARPQRSHPPRPDRIVESVRAQTQLQVAHEQPQVVGSQCPTRSDSARSASGIVIILVLLRRAPGPAIGTAPPSAPPGQALPVLSAARRQIHQPRTAPSTAAHTAALRPCPTPVVQTSTFNYGKIHVKICMTGLPQKLGQNPRPPVNIPSAPEEGIAPRRGRRDGIARHSMQLPRRKRTASIICRWQ
ncbi:hypothetical protein STENM223S_00072 [Streptomyces tendae]